VSGGGKCQITRGVSAYNECAEIRQAVLCGSLTVDTETAMYSKLVGLYTYHAQPRPSAKREIQ